jgi:Uma2 family endonuclease
MAKVRAENTMVVDESTRWAVELAQLWSPQGEWTEDEYFTLPDTNRFIELSEGELIMPPHPTHTHQRAVLRLAAAMYTFVQSQGLGTVQVAPLPVRLWPGKIREPDILFMAKEHSDRISEQFYGPPDVIVEVLSPGTWRADRREKLVEYARAGIDEYWIVDPSAHTIEVFTLREGAYTLLGKWGSEETVKSEVLTGLDLRVGDVVGED